SAPEFPPNSFCCHAWELIPHHDFDVVSQVGISQKQKSALPACQTPAVSTRRSRTLCGSTTVYRHASLALSDFIGSAANLSPIPRRPCPLQRHGACADEEPRATALVAASGLVVPNRPLGRRPQVGGSRSVRRR